MEEMRVLSHNMIGKQILGKIIRLIRIISLYNMLNLKNSHLAFIRMYY